MIRNILFDMGNVMIRWDPMHFIDQLNIDNEEERTLLYRTIYGSKEWVSIDHGHLSEEELYEKVIKKLPSNLHDKAEQLIFHWDEEHLEMEGMEEIVSGLYSNYNLYLLTNAGQRHHEYWNGFPVSRYFTKGVMLSSDWKILKPDERFYLKAMELFNLKPEECVFIDDNAMNVEAAELLGIHGIIFDGDIGYLKENLRDLNISI